MASNVDLNIINEGLKETDDLLLDFKTQHGALEKRHLEGGQLSRHEIRKLKHLNQMINDLERTRHNVMKNTEVQNAMAAAKRAEEPEEPEEPSFFDSGIDLGKGLIEMVRPRWSEWNSPKKVGAQLVRGAASIGQLPMMATGAAAAGINKLLGREPEKTLYQNVEEGKAYLDKQAGLDPKRFSGAETTGNLALPLPAGAAKTVFGAGQPIWKQAVKGAGFGALTEAARQTAAGEEEFDPDKLKQAATLSAILNPVFNKVASKFGGRPSGVGEEPVGGTGPSVTTKPPVPPSGRGEGKPSSSTVSDETLFKAAREMKPIREVQAESTSLNAGEAAKQVAGNKVTQPKGRPFLDREPTYDEEMNLRGPAAFEKQGLSLKDVLAPPKAAPTAPIADDLKAVGKIAKGSTTAPPTVFSMPEGQPTLPGIGDFTRKGPASMTDMTGNALPGGREMPWEQLRQGRVAAESALPPKIRDKGQLNIPGTSKSALEKLMQPQPTGGNVIQHTTPEAKKAIVPKVEPVPELEPLPPPDYLTESPGYELAKGQNVRHETAGPGIIISEPKMVGGFNWYTVKFKDGHIGKFTGIELEKIPTSSAKNLPSPPTAQQGAPPSLPASAPSPAPAPSPTPSSLRPEVVDITPQSPSVSLQSIMQPKTLAEEMATAGKIPKEAIVPKAKSVPKVEPAQAFSETSDNPVFKIVKGPLNYKVSEAELSAYNKAREQTADIRVAVETAAKSVPVNSPGMKALLNRVQGGEQAKPNEGLTEALKEVEKKHQREDLGEFLKKDEPEGTKGTLKPSPFNPEQADLPQTPAKAKLESPIAERPPLEDRLPLEPVGRQRKWLAPDPIKQKTWYDYEQQDADNLYFKLRDEGKSVEEADAAVTKLLASRQKARDDARTPSILEQVAPELREPEAAPELRVTPSKLSQVQLEGEPIERLAEHFGSKLKLRSDPMYGDSYEISLPSGQKVRGDENTIRKALAAIQEHPDSGSNSPTMLYSGVDPVMAWNQAKSLGGSLTEAAKVATVHPLNTFTKPVLRPQFNQRNQPVGKMITEAGDQVPRNITQIAQGMMYHPVKGAKAEPKPFYYYETAPDDVAKEVQHLSEYSNTNKVWLTADEMRSSGVSEPVIKAYLGRKSGLEEMADLIEQALRLLRLEKGLDIFKRGKDGILTDEFIPLLRRIPGYLNRNWGGSYEIYLGSEKFLRPDGTSSFKTPFALGETLYQLKQKGLNPKVKLWLPHDFSLAADVNHMFALGKAKTALEEAGSIRADEISALFARFGKRTDFGKALLKRTGEKGYSIENIREIDRAFMMSGARFVANTRFKIDAYRALDPSITPQAKNINEVDMHYLKSFIERVLGRETFADAIANTIVRNIPGVNLMLDANKPFSQLASGARHLVVQMKLGVANPLFGIINTTSALVHTWPGLSAVANKAKLGAFAADKFFKQGIQTWNKAVAGDATSKALVSKMVQEGIVQIHFLTNPQPTLGKVNKVEKMNMVLAQVSEEFVRTTAAISRYKMALAQGMNEKQALDATYKFVNFTQGNYHVSGRPPAFTGQVGETGGLFKTWASVAAENFYMNTVGAMQNKDAGTIARYLSAAIATGGLSSLAAAHTIDGLWTRATGDSPIEKAKEKLGAGITYGVGSTMGLYLSGRAGIGDLIPARIEDIVSPGILQPIWKSIFAEDESVLDPYLWARQFVPTPPGYRQYYPEKLSGSIKGRTLRDKKGHIVLDDLTKAERYWSLIGTPERIGEMYDTHRIDRARTTYAKRQRKSILQDLLENPNDSKAWRLADQFGITNQDVIRAEKERETPLPERHQKSLIKILRD